MRPRIIDYVKADLINASPTDVPGMTDSIGAPGMAAIAGQPVYDRVFIALGSNLGDRHEYLRRAREALARGSFTELTRTSTMLDNPPLYLEEQPDFLNQVLEIATTLEPHDLLTYCKSLERSLGRTPSVPNGPREIDIDLLAFQDRRLASRDLTLPHPGVFERSYIRELLAELDETPESITRSVAR